ncbi:putative lipid II flippase FtsW [Solimonas marina]|uniref:Probable peptidoglycan glycosyltransferase FtsW n=1 Tax=Solimonas marina TaxID=2714601 RepID=A0A970B6L1_9GAMM|nr:putative lipid II flippase FtsW [Solimonas marina]NKF22928.1 putative lipid II flippase FtsW [Solimonas marina]
MSATGDRWGIPETRFGVDNWLCGAIATLLLWGLIMVASASVAQATKLTGDPFYFFYRQLLFMAVGGAGGFALYCVPMRQWQRSSNWLLLFAVALLALVLIPGIGVKVNGARRWIDVGLFRLQASEPVRLALIIWISAYITRRQVQLQSSLKGLAMPIIAILFPCFLLLCEPDFGATAILLGVVFLMLFLGGARVHYYAMIVGVAGAGLALIAVAAPYRLQRMLNFMNPWADVENAGWQLAQSLIAVGRGEWTGVGLGNSVQKLLYLPEMHTDFIFAILAEEFGLLGIAILLSLFGIVVWRGFAIARAAELDGRRFSAYLCYGLSGWIGLQALINMAVNMGLLPTKGLTLPMISSGGSSLMTVCALIGLILRVDYENRAAAGGVVSTENGARERPLRTDGARAQGVRS